MLLVGFDVEDGETKFGGAADEVETDLLAGAPGWWAEIVRTRHPGAFLDGAESDPITLVCGWDGKNWTKAIGAPDATLVAQCLELDEDA
ncbi:hypothetical protein [Spirillospora sp. NPDC048819]|uniref:hypothetical protein n=1 Tax=Spirillospora sp. NPDC048819 TaxID=3155268 RepID=UPI0033EC758C